MAPPLAANPLVTLHAPETVVLGAKVRMTIRIHNRSDEPLELYLTGRETVCDLTVKNADGEPVWRRLHGAVLQAILRLELVAPRATLEFLETWDQQDDSGTPVPPGSYTVSGAVPTDGSSRLDAQPVPLTITPR
jgi:hypothetical protein